MNEVKSPRRPLMWFYGITLAIIILFNLVFRPMVTEAQIKTVDYGTFMTMTEEENIGQVEIRSNQILFTDKAGTQVYKTGPMNDPDLADRLHAAGASFSGEIIEEPNFLLSFLATWVLPMVIFVVIGQVMCHVL